MSTRTLNHANVSDSTFKLRRRAGNLGIASFSLSSLALSLPVTASEPAAWIGRPAGGPHVDGAEWHRLTS